MDDCESENRLNYSRVEYNQLKADKKRQAENLEGEIERIAEEKNDLVFENAELLAKNEQLLIKIDWLEELLRAFKGTEWAVYKEHHGLNQWTYWLDCNDIKICKLTQQQYEAFDQLQDENERLKEENRWIPVSEGLPKNPGRLLAFGKDGYGYEIVIATTYNFEFKKFRILQDVTHWKPIILPEQSLE